MYSIEYLAYVVNVYTEQFPLPRNRNCDARTISSSRLGTGPPPNVQTTNLPNDVSLLAKHEPGTRISIPLLRTSGEGDSGPTRAETTSHVEASTSSRASFWGNQLKFRFHRPDSTKILEIVPSATPNR